MKLPYHLVVLILLSLPALSQDLKYKEIYPYIETKNYREAVPYLLEFLQYEPDHPSANLQLALIYERRFKNYHPILKYKAALKNAENAKTRFLKARLLIDEKEIRRNGKKFYTNFATLNDRGKPEVEYQTVRLTIDSAYMEIDNFIRHVPMIFSHFTKSVQYYDKAAKAFAEINGQYNSLKELYLLYNPTLKSSLARLKSDYDSTLYFFNAYLKASENYPVTEYKQSYTIKPIVHYRLDGLITQNDFLAQKIEFWDYGSWVDQVNEMVSTEIASLRRQIELNEQRLDEALEVLKYPSQAITANIQPDEVDRELILKLRNFDFNSVVTPLLLYKNSKQDLLYQALLEYEMAEDTVNSGSYESLLAYYNRMFNLSLKGDSLLEVLESHYSEANYQKHDDYLDEYYYGIEGLQKFINSEEEFIDSKMNEYSRQIKLHIVRNLPIYDDSTRFISVGKLEIPFYVTLPDSLDKLQETVYTKGIRMAPDSSYYVGGIKKSANEGYYQAFLGRINQENELLWMNDLEIDQAVLDSLERGPEEDSTVLEEQEVPERIFNNLLSAMELTPEGCALMITSVDTASGNLYNTFKVISETGEEIHSRLLMIDAIGKKIRYNNESNSYLLAFKGKDISDDFRLPQTSFLKRIDMEGNDVWETDLLFSGNIKELLNINTGYLVIGEYTQIRRISGNEVVTNPDPEFTNAYIYKLSPAGKIMDQLLIRSENSYYIERVVKINDSSINLIGFNGREEGDHVNIENNVDDLVHIITNARLKILRSSVDLL